MKSITHFCQTQPGRVVLTRQKIKAYILQLHRLRLQDALLGQGKRLVLRRSISLTAYLMLGLPVYIFGLLHNYVPYSIPAKVARGVTSEQEWYAPIAHYAYCGYFYLPAGLRLTSMAAL